VYDPRELEERAKHITDDALVKRWITSPDPRLSRPRKSRSTSSWGFTNLVFHGPGDDQVRFIQAYAAEVLPRLRREIRLAHRPDLRCRSQQLGADRLWAERVLR